MNAGSTAARIQQLFRELNDYLRADGFIKVVYKPVPHIFHRIPSEEDIYSLFSVCDAKLIDRSISSTLILQYPLKWHRDRRYGINKAKAHDVTVDESQDLKGFWEVLTFNLRNKYDSCPVHSLEEIELLHDRFPQQIRLFTASKTGRYLVAQCYTSLQRLSIPNIFQRIWKESSGESLTHFSIICCMNVIGNRDILILEPPMRRMAEYWWNRLSIRRKVLVDVVFVTIGTNGRYDQVLGLKTGECSLRRGDATCH